jgi:D-glycero-D-manno-heptose 1,7-bisphosphate phosphatase
MTREAVEEIHRNLRVLLKKRHRLELLDVLCCPHGEDECDCRKPKPGMLLEAARRYALDLKSSWMVGDHETDVSAGRAAGCRTILVGERSDTQADCVVRNMTDLKSLIEKKL